jgi:hypothetical protein
LREGNQRGRRGRRVGAGRCPLWGGGYTGTLRVLVLRFCGLLTRLGELFFSRSSISFLLHLSYLVARPGRRDRAFNSQSSSQSVSGGGGRCGRSIPGLFPFLFLLFSSASFEGSGRHALLQAIHPSLLLGDLRWRRIGKVGGREVIDLLVVFTTHPP